MNRPLLRITLDVVGTIVLALVLLTVLLSVFSGSFVEGLSEVPQMVVLFIGPSLAVWVILLVIAAVRSRGAGPDARYTVLFAGLGASVTTVLYVVTGIVQGGWALLFVLFAVMAGVAFLVAAAIVIPLVRRALRPPRA